MPRSPVAQFVELKQLRRVLAPKSPVAKFSELNNSGRPKSHRAMKLRSLVPQVTEHNYSGRP